jgi:hypothetical protein
VQRVLPRAAVKLLGVDTACGVQVAVGDQRRLLSDHLAID